MQIEKVFKNTRIYDLNGDIEAVYYRPGWGGSNSVTPEQRSARGCSPDYEKHRQKTLQKARSKIRRLVKRYSLDRFVTLTFGENLSDVKEADREFGKFMKRLMRRLDELKYVAVREFQKRGAVHYHMAINTYIDHKQLGELWNNGWVWIEKEEINDQNHLVNYLCKYLMKSSDDKRLRGYHAYLCSQGLKLPFEEQYFDTKEDMLDYLTGQFKEVMEKKRILEFEDGQIVWVG